MLRPKKFKIVEDEDNKAVHKKFIESVKNLTKSKQIQKPTRSEPSEANNEFHLGKLENRSAGFSVTKDIFEVLKKKNQHVSVAKELLRSRKTKKVLKKNLEAPVADRLHRTIGYEKAKKKLAKWDGIVARNLTIETQTFPVETDVVFKNVSKEKLIKSVKSDLMADMEVIEAKLKPVKTVSEEKREKEKNMTREEIIASRRELAYIKMQYAQKCAKQRRQNKIKSKSYHRLMKRRNIATEMKQTALLEKNDPEAALRNLESADRKRILERASLKHKNTGLWAKNIISRTKNNDDLRKDLAEQLKLSRELTQKQKIDDEISDDDNGMELDKSVDDDNDPMNPWVKISKSVNTQIPNSESGNYRKYWEERNLNEKKLKKFLNGDSDDNEEVTEKDELKNLRDLSFKNTSIRPDFDEELTETPRNVSGKVKSTLVNLKERTEKESDIPAIDPYKFTERVAKPTFKTFDLHEINENNLDENEHKVTLADAFEDDDIVADFEKEREEKTKAESENLVLSMPGWGSWVSADTINCPKRKRIVLKFSDKNKPPPKGNVTINEIENKKFKEHLVSDLPFPFTSVKEYEASIRAPIGRSFVPETAFRALTQPSVITKKGKVINPMDESILVAKKKTNPLEKRKSAVSK